MIRTLKHLLRGERKVQSGSITYKEFEELVEQAGDNIRYRARAGSGFKWLTEKSDSSHLEFLLDFFRPEDHRLYTHRFFGNHEVFAGRQNETHYVDAHTWVKSANTKPEGQKSHEGTVYFTIERQETQ